MGEHLEFATAFARARGAFGQVRAALRDVLVGASGADAYGNYVAHLRRHHPGQTPLSRAAFGAADLSARWNGVRRCC